MTLHGRVGERCRMPHSYEKAQKAQVQSNIEGIRLQKVLASAGYGSRRKCEELITQGRVEVDGELVRELGTRVYPDKQEIRVDGSRIHLNDKQIVLMLNKPPRVLSALEDRTGRWTLRDFINPRYGHVFHMGRLDYDSEGLILMTNDGELSEHVMHPRYQIPKTYVATLQGKIPGNVLRRMVGEGIKLDDGWISFDKAAIVDSAKDRSIVRVTLHSGKNRIVRRMFDAVGYPVKRLVRVAIGPITLGDLPTGESRLLSRSQVQALEKAVDL